MKMESLKKLLHDGVEKDYMRAIELTEVESKTDPVTEPYRSMYAAREVWQSIGTRLQSLKDNNETLPECSFLLTAIDFKMGMNCIETEEKSAGIDHLKKCIDMLDDIKFNEKVCYLYLTALNQLGIVYSELTGPKSGLEYLIRSECLHDKFEKTVGTSPWTIDDLFLENSYLENPEGFDKIIQKRMEAFEDAHTHTLYFLAQVYEKMGESEMAAGYCHRTLHRQLDSHKYNPLDWSMNAATLSQYYCTTDDFMLARHCLAAAELILLETGDRPESLFVSCDENDGASELATREKVPKAWADLHRCWSKYGLALLQFSRDRLYDEIDQPEKENTEKQIKNLSLNATSNTIDQEEKNGSGVCGNGDTGGQTERAVIGDQDDPVKDEAHQMLFNLELTSIESRVVDKPICVFDEARAVFLRVQEWLTAAKDFYRLDGHCTDHVDINRDHSTAFRLLAFFEVDLERQCKMHKRRADMLQAVLNELNPQHYLLVCRQLMFEIAETYSTMLDNKLALLELQPPTSRPAMQHVRKKINSLSRQSIEQFRAYIDSFKDLRSGKLPDKFPADDVRPALIAHFYIARLYSKIIEPEVDDQLKNVKHSLDYYQFLVDYCKNDPEGRERVRSEVEICEEMVTLLPAKMDKLLAKMDGSNTFD